MHASMLINSCFLWHPMATAALQKLLMKLKMRDLVNEGNPMRIYDWLTDDWHAFHFLGICIHWTGTHFPCSIILYSLCLIEVSAFLSTDNGFHMFIILRK